jgi:hypothetical protein
MITTVSMELRLFRRDVLSQLKLLLLSGGLALLSAGCDRESRVVEEPITEPMEVSTPTPIVVATPTPAPAKKMLYLKRRVSLSDDTGIYGFAPGTELKLVSQKGGTMAVIANGRQIEVKETDTTWDASEIVAAPTKPSPKPLVQQTPPMQPQSQSAPQSSATPPPDAAATAAAAAAAAKAAQREQRKQRILQLKQQIAALTEQRQALYRQTNASGRDPSKTPEGKARIAQMEQLSLQIRQLNVQIGQLR